RRAGVVQNGAALRGLGAGIGWGEHAALVLEHGPGTAIRPENEPRIDETIDAGDPLAGSGAGRAWRAPADALAWLVRATGAAGAAYVHLDADGYIRSEVAPLDLDEEPRAEFADRARELFVSGVLGAHADEAAVAVTWYAHRAIRAVIASGAS